MNGDSQFSDSEVSRQLETAIKDMFVSSTDKTVEKKKFNLVKNACFF